MKEAFLATIGTWFIAISVGVLPFMLGSAHLDLIDALFESCSMLTTTGANLILGLEIQEKTVHAWCAVLQWLGGKGIVMMGIILLPLTKNSGSNLIQTESLDVYVKNKPRLVNATSYILGVYLILTLTCFVALMLNTLSPFEAFCHSLATVATGGFSPWDNSLQGSHTASTHFTIGLFMMLGSLSFVNYSKITQDGFKAFIKDQQTQGFLKCVLFFVALITVWRLGISSKPFLSVLNETFFNVVSALSTTGYVSANYSSWGTVALITFLFLPFIGGCTNSTTGGLKVYRLQVTLKALVAYFKKIVYPNAVAPIYYNNKTVETQRIMEVLVYVILYILVFVVLSILVSFYGYDMVTTLSSVVACLTNLGPGLGEIIGPTGSYYDLPDSLKLILTMTMLAGRIELTVLILLMTPRFWHD